MKRLLLITMCLSMLLAFSGCMKEEEETEFGVMKDPISDIGYADSSDIEIIELNIEDINKDNADEYVLNFYGYELEYPETWTISDAKGKMLNDFDNETEIVFENFTDEEVETYIEEFYDYHHIGDKKLSKFKTSDGYSWNIQNKGSSIKHTYTFKKEGNKLSLLIGKYF